MSWKSRALFPGAAHKGRPTKESQDTKRLSFFLFCRNTGASQPKMFPGNRKTIEITIYVSFELENRDNKVDAIKYTRQRAYKYF